MPDLAIERSEDWQKWDDYVFNHPNGTLYHLSPWKNAIEKSFQLRADYFWAIKENKICGILPLFLVKTFFHSSKLVSIPYAVYGGILADDLNIEQELFNYSIAFAENNNADHIEFRCLHDPGYKLPKEELYVTHIKELEKTEEEILLSIPRKSRASVRKAYSKYDMDIKVDKDLNTLYKLYLMNKRELGSPPYPYSFFEHLSAGYGDNAGVLTVLYQNMPAAGIFYFKYKDVLMPYFSGSNSKYNFTNANNVLYFELMKYGLNNGFKYFDFGRSRVNSGSGKFKQYMGFTPQSLHYYHYLTGQKEIPNINPSNPKFNLASSIWSKLPLRLTELLGPTIVKRIP